MEARLWEFAYGVLLSELGIGLESSCLEGLQLSVPEAKEGRIYNRVGQKCLSDTEGSALKHPCVEIRWAPLLDNSRGMKREEPQGV